MNDLLPPPVPQLSDEWISSRQIALTDALSQSRGVGVKWGTLAGATGVAATVSVLTAVLIAGGAPHTPRVTPYAFAGWRASPTTPTDAQLTAADSTCQSALARLSGTNTAADVASFVPELSDERGPFTVTVFGNGGQDAAMCLFVANAIQVRWLEESGMAVVVRCGRRRWPLWLRNGQPYTLVEGTELTWGDRRHSLAGRRQQRHGEQWKRALRGLVAGKSDHHIGDCGHCGRYNHANREPGWSGRTGVTRQSA